MTKETVDVSMYQGWYKEMEMELGEMERKWGDRTDFFRQIGLVRENIQRLQCAPVYFDDREIEIIYHRDIWPRFYGKLFFYLLAQRFCYQWQVLPSWAASGLVSKEEGRICRFFSWHKRFWADYLFGAPHFAEQFTRPYNKGMALDPLSMILDAAGGTMAGYRVAWGLAYEEFRKWLRSIEDLASVPAKGKYEWKETKSAAAELIKSQVEARSIYINGKPATAAQLRADFEQRYHVDLKDFDNLLYAMDTLKSDNTPYLSKLKRGFESWKKWLGK